jgi:predicted tellurium resistance membrane protein TerC
MCVRDVVIAELLCTVVDRRGSVPVLLIIFLLPLGVGLGALTLEVESVLIPSGGVWLRVLLSVRAHTCTNEASIDAKARNGQLSVPII